MIFDILFLPFIFLIGIVTSYGDVRYGKVRNKWIILGLIWGLTIIVFFFVWYFIASPITRYYYFEIQNLPDGSPAPVFTVSLTYLAKVILNTVIALVVAFLMWRFNAWAAGDAKLFVVYALLLPLKYYWKSYLPYFPSFVLLINIFIPIFLYLLFRSCFYYFKFIYLRLTKTDNKNKLLENSRARKKTDKKKASWEKIKSMVIMFLGFIGIFLVFGLFQEPIKEHFTIDISSLQMFIFAALIIFSGALSKIFQRPLTFKIIIISLVIILGYGFISSPNATWQTIYQTIKIMAVFMVILTLFRKLIDFYVLKTGLEEIKIKDIKPRINLTEETLGELKKDKKYYNKYIGPIYPGGLTLEQAVAVRKWLQKNQQNKTETISTYKPFPFVIWMFIGVIITLIFKSSLLHLFLGLS